MDNLGENKERVNVLIRRLRHDADVGFKSLRMIFDEKKYKTRTALEEFQDSLQTKQVLTHTFDRYMKEAFEEVDIDNSGTIDRAEFYAGMLVLYHKLNMIPWGGRKPPPKRVFVMELFDHYLEEQRAEIAERGSSFQQVLLDQDAGTSHDHFDALTYKTFKRLCRDHFQTVASGVVTRIILVALIFPIIALKLKDLVLIDKIAAFDSLITSIFLTLLIFLLPYAEAIVIRRVWADSDGFAHFTVTPQGKKIKRQVDKNLKEE